MSGASRSFGDRIVPTASRPLSSSKRLADRLAIPIRLEDVVIKTDDEAPPQAVPRQPDRAGGRARR